MELNTNDQPRNVLLRDPLLYSNNLPEILLAEELACKRQDEQETLKVIQNFTVLNKRNLIVNANGEVVPVPKFVEVCFVVLPIRTALLILVAIVCETKPRGYRIPTAEINSERTIAVDGESE
jgi:hypothetical protein